MSLIKFEVTVPAEMASVLTTESLDDLPASRSGNKLASWIVKADPRAGR
jgi:hypothetical protein